MIVEYEDFIKGNWRIQQRNTMTEELYALLKKHECAGDFTHANVTDGMLNGAEKRMNIKIPEEYRSFLKEFGHGGISGTEVLGVGKNGVLVFERETLKYRTYGLPNELIVIENCGEWLYCLNSDNGSVVMCSGRSANYTEAFGDFETYLYDRVNDMLENM